jgi:hypothetical protein
MSGQMPLFASAPRVQLKIGDNTLGYAIGFNFNLSVDVQPVYGIGSFAPVSLEPTFYNTVTGTIQIIRLSNKKARQAQLIAADASIDPMTGNDKSTVRGWNGAQVGSGPAATGDLAGAAEANSPLGAPGTLYAHLDPTSVMLSQLFDMDVYIAIPTANALTPAVTTGEDAVARKVEQATKREMKKWFTIRGCRITSRNTNITFGQIVNEPVSFNGLLVTPVDSSGNDSFSLDSMVKDLKA